MFGTAEGGDAGTEEDRRAEGARRLAAELEKERVQVDAANAMERMKKELAQEKRQKIITAYKDKVNFVVIDGDGRDQASAGLVERFRVDGIPHLALMTNEGEVKTALIGKVPKKVLEADIDSLIAGRALPYEGYDAFEDDNHFVTF
ncbi:thiol:disulfide interchange protein [Nannochloropsis oceanica]